MPHQGTINSLTYSFVKSGMHFDQEAYFIWQRHIHEKRTERTEGENSHGSNDVIEK